MSEIALQVYASAPFAVALLTKGELSWKNTAWSRLPAEILDRIWAEAGKLDSTNAPQTLSIERRGQVIEIASQALGSHDGALLTVLASEARLHTLFGKQPVGRALEDDGELPIFTERLKTYGVYGQRTLNYDWVNTPLGPISSWNDTLKTAISAILASNLATVLWIGDGETPLIIHNQAYANLLKGIEVFGREGERGYDRNWPALLELRKHVMQTKQGMSEKDSRWDVFNEERSLEERYFDYEFIPLYSPEGELVLCTNRAFETTERVLARRRLALTQKVGDLVSVPGDTKAFCAAFLEALATNATDIPFCLLYTTSVTSAAQPDELLLCGTKGLPDDHAWLVSPLRVAPSAEQSESSEYARQADELPWKLSQVLQTRQSIVVDGLEGQAADKAIVLPIVGENAQMLGVLVLALNKRRVFDPDYQRWTALLAQSASSGLSQTVQSSRIEELERLRGQLDDLAHEMRAMADSSTVGIFNLDENGSVLYLNPMWYQIVGAPRDMPGDQWPNHVKPDNLAEVYRIFKDAIDNTDSCELTAEWNSGAATLVTMRPWQLRDGTQRFTGCVVDVTELRRLERLQIEAAQERATEAEEQKRLQEISVDVSSHELRNPLSAISQAAELLDGGLDRIAAAADRYLETSEISESVYDTLIDELVFCDETLEAIKLSSQHQRRVADDILNFSKLNMQLITLNRQPIDVVELAEVTAKMLQPELQKHKLRVIISQDPSLGLYGGRYIHADSYRLGQVMVNFLTNAVRYTTESPRREIEIWISASPTMPVAPPDVMRVMPPSEQPAATLDDGVWTTLSVRDYGRGLSPEERQQLFKRFHQVKPNTDGLSGFGLGLYISKSIVHLHSGFIELRSVALGEGSTFSFCIPAQRASSEQVVPFVPQEATLRATELSKRRPDSVDQSNPMRPRRKRHGSSFLSITSNKSDSSGKATPVDPFATNQVLIADDSPINLRLLQMQLERRGYTVLLAANGQEVLDLVRKHRPSLMAALVDVQMPVKSGPEAVRELRQEETGLNLMRLFCIAVTGNAREAQKQAVLEAGYDKVATKPYNIEEVCRWIEEGGRKQ